MSYDEFIEKYGDVVVTFSSYYKYCFRYKAVLESGETIIVSIGGDTDDIYRWEIQNNESLTIRELEPNYGWLNDKDDVCIETFIFN